MVYIIKKHPYIILLISVFISCNQIEIEEDKYPDMLFLPEHTNPEIEIISLGYHIDSLYKNSEGSRLEDLYFFKFNDINYELLKCW